MEWGLSEAEFWRLTPREYAVLQRRFDAVEERKDYRAALITSWVANSIPSKTRKRAYKPSDFMPRKQARRTEVESKAASTGDTAGMRTFNKLSTAMRVLGGRKGRGETPAQKEYRLAAIERYRRWKTATVETAEE